MTVGVRRKWSGCSISGWRPKGIDEWSFTMMKAESSSGDNLTAVILAGGLGTRLRSVVPDRQKVMATVAGRPFLAYLLDQIAQFGIRQAVVCTGYRANDIPEYFQDEYKGIRLVYSQETQQMGTAGALRLALAFIHTFPALVFNGDSYVDVDIERLLNFHLLQQGVISMALAKKEARGRYGIVEMDHQGLITTFLEKASTHKPEWVNAGIYVMERQVLQSIPDHKAVSLERETFPTWVHKGLFGFAQQGALLDIGTPASLATADAYFRKKPDGSCIHFPRMTKVGVG